MGFSLQVRMDGLFKIWQDSEAWKNSHNLVSYSGSGRYIMPDPVILPLRLDIRRGIIRDNAKVIESSFQDYKILASNLGLCDKNSTSSQLLKNSMYMIILIIVFVVFLQQIFIELLLSPWHCFRWEDESNINILKLVKR